MNSEPEFGSFVKIAKPRGGPLYGAYADRRQHHQDLWERHQGHVWEVYKRPTKGPRVQRWDEVWIRRSVRNGKKFKRVLIDWHWLTPAAPLEALAAQAAWPKKARY